MVYNDGKKIFTVVSQEKKKQTKSPIPPLKSLKVAPLIRYKLSKLQQAKKKDLLGH